MTEHDVDIAFSMECHTVGNLLQHGLAALERAEPGSSSDMTLPALLVSSGLERLCKLVLWRAHQPVKDIHDVRLLVERVVKTCFVPGCPSTRESEDDRRFLTDDPHVASFIRFLTAYAHPTRGRYLHLERLKGTPAPADDVYRAWREWDTKLNEADPALAEMAYTTGGLEYRYAVTRLRVRFAERLFRAITRLLYSLPPRGKVAISDPLTRFASLPDDALGKTDYLCYLRWYDPFRGFRECGVFAYASRPPNSQ